MQGGAGPAEAIQHTEGLKGNFRTCKHGRLSFVHTWEAEIGAILCSMAWETMSCAMLCSMEECDLCNVAQHGRVTYVQCCAAQRAVICAVLCSIQLSVQDCAICSMCTICEAASTMHSRSKVMSHGRFAAESEDICTQQSTAT